MTRERLPVWQIPVTHTLDELVEEAVSKDTHVSKSDLVREAVREKLARMGFTYVNNAPSGSPTKHGAKP
jgi:hypothetical protein